MFRNNKMLDMKFFGVVLLTGFSAVVSAEYCSYYDDDSWFSTDTMWCDHGCCGDMYNRYCCEYETVGAIVGIVIGSIFALVLVVSVIVAICCCCRKSRGRAGQVCQPNYATQPGQTVAYGVPNTTVAYGSPVAYGNVGVVQTTTIASGGPVYPPQVPMQPNPYAQAPPKYEDVSNTQPQAPQN